MPSSQHTITQYSKSSNHPHFEMSHLLSFLVELFVKFQVDQFSCACILYSMKNGVSVITSRELNVYSLLF